MGSVPEMVVALDQDNFGNCLDVGRVMRIECSIVRLELHERGLDLIYLSSSGSEEYPKMETKPLVLRIRRCDLIFARDNWLHFHMRREPLCCLDSEVPLNSSYSSHRNVFEAPNKG